MDIPGRMPTDEQKAQYAANRSAKRRADKYEAMPETKALRAELKALQQSIAGERAYMESAEYESQLRERAEWWKSQQFRKGMAAGKELMAEYLSKVKEKLAIVEEELEDANWP